MYIKKKIHQYIYYIYTLYVLSDFFIKINYYKFFIFSLIIYRWLQIYPILEFYR